MPQQFIITDAGKQRFADELAVILCSNSGSKYSEIMLLFELLRKENDNLTTQSSNAVHTYISSLPPPMAPSSDRESTTLNITALDQAIASVRTSAFDTNYRSMPSEALSALLQPSSLRHENDPLGLWDGIEVHITRASLEPIAESVVTPVDWDSEHRVSPRTRNRVSSPNMERVKAMNIGEVLELDHRGAGVCTVLQRGIPPMCSLGSAINVYARKSGKVFDYSHTDFQKIRIERLERNL